MLAAISASHLSPLLSSFSLLYRSSSCVSVENSKLGPCGRGQVQRHQAPRPPAPEHICPRPRPRPPHRPAHLHDGVHGAGLLAEAAIDTLGHVDVIARGPAAAIGPRLSLDGDGLREGYRVPQLLLSAPSWGLTPGPPTLGLRHPS